MDSEGFRIETRRTVSYTGSRRVWARWGEPAEAHVHERSGPPLELDEILLAGPRGFCAGVERAIEIVEIALGVYGAPVYVRKEIVHNRHVVQTLRAKGAVFVDELSEVPDGALVIFSAHGVSPAVREEARARRLRVIDATCPLVTKVHLEAIRYAGDGYTIILVGHEDHDEVIGTTGEAPGTIRVISSVDEVAGLEVPDPARVVYLTQTTLSVDDTQAVIEALRQKFPAIVGSSKEDICYATQNRQAAVKAVAGQVEVVLVLGAGNSSNAIRLREVAEAAGARAYLIDDPRDIRREWFDGVRRVGVTAGASTPEFLVRQTINALSGEGATALREVQVVEEDVRFAIPRELMEVSRAKGGPPPDRSHLFS